METTSLEEPRVDEFSNAAREYSINLVLNSPEMLQTYKNDLERLVAKYPGVVAPLKYKLEHGRIQGSLTDQCLLNEFGIVAYPDGELAPYWNFVRQEGLKEYDSTLLYRRGARIHTPIEEMALLVNGWETPESSPVVATLVDWLNEFEGEVA